MTWGGIYYMPDRLGISQVKILLVTIYFDKLLKMKVQFVFSVCRYMQLNENLNEKRAQGRQNKFKQTQENKYYKNNSNFEDQARHR